MENNEKKKAIEGEIATTEEQPKATAIVPSTTAQPPLIVGENSVEKATAVANALKDVVEKQKLFSLIEGKKYVKVEGWNTLGALMGVFPMVVSAEKLQVKPIRMYQVKITKSKKDWNTNQWKNYEVFDLVQPALFFPGDSKMVKVGEAPFEELAYKSVVELRRLDGTVISKAEAFCSNLEESKHRDAEYSIMSMAQTRATGKAFRIAFSWIMAMAGYEATPAEEVPVEGFGKEEPKQTAPKPTQTYAPRNTSNYRKPQDEEVRYVDVGNDRREPQAPSTRWENNNGYARPSASTSYECHGCGNPIPEVVANYSKRFFGKPLCRECQKTAQRVPLQ